MDKMSHDSKEDTNVPLLQKKQDKQGNAGNGRNEIGNEEQGNQNENLSNKWQTIWNIINGQQGASLLGAPYAVSVGGFWSLIPLGVITIIANYTSKILIQCLIKDDRDGDVALEEIRKEQDSGENNLQERLIQNGSQKIRHTYMEVASDCFPGCGVIVRVAILISAFSISVLYVQTMGAIVLDVAANYVEIPRDAVMVICVGASVGFAFASNLTQLSLLSLLALICLAMLTLGIDTFTMRHLDALYVDYLTPFSPYNILYATSIIVFNFSSQFFIIDIHNSLADKSDFNFIVNVSSLVSVILIIALSVPACLSFGPTIDEFVIFSMPPGVFKTVTCLAFLLKSFLSFPLTIFICEIYSPRWFFPDSEAGCNCFGRCDLNYLLKSSRRVLLMLCSCVVAVWVESYAFVLYLIGGTVMVFTEIIFPPLFHVILRKQLTVLEKLADVLMILYGLVTGLSTVAIAIQNIISGRE